MHTLSQSDIKNYKYNLNEDNEEAEIYNEVFEDLKYFYAKKRKYKYRNTFNKPLAFLKDLQELLQ